MHSHKTAAAVGGRREKLRKPSIETNRRLPTAKPLFVMEKREKMNA